MVCLYCVARNKNSLLCIKLWRILPFSICKIDFLGRTIDPLDLHEQVGRVSFFQTGMGYKANITMHSIKMFGLSSIRLAESTVTRNMNLTDIDVKLVFAFDKLTINGSYALKVKKYFFLHFRIIFHLERHTKL